MTVLYIVGVTVFCGAFVIGLLAGLVAAYLVYTRPKDNAPRVMIVFAYTVIGMFEAMIIYLAYDIAEIVFTQVTPSVFL